MSGQVSYRAMQAADLPALARLLPSLLAGDWSLSSLQQLLVSSHACRLLSSTGAPGSQLLGFAEFVLVADECQLLNIAIAPEVQGAGLGRHLLRKVLGEAKEAGCRHCFLEVRQSNDAAIGLYVDSGFELTGMRKAYYPPRGKGESAEHALLYALELG